MLASLATLAFFATGIVAQTLTTVAPAPWVTGVITEDGTCGNATQDGWVCSPSWGACCGASGKCGRSDVFCGDGCQQGYGNCNAPPPPPPAPPAKGDPSPDGSCGGEMEFTCNGTSHGSCCSLAGFCGDLPAHCGSGCQSLFGNCTDTGDVSTDGQCGANGKTCVGSNFGSCCSASGWCGDDSGFCGAGCQDNFGNCTTPGGGNVSIDGFCGTNGKTCLGSSFGKCCSKDGYCGDDSGHCQSGCQAQFGTCDAPTDISTDGQCGANGKTCTGSTFGKCCSASGWCGDDAGFCEAGCQTAFGTCKGGAGSISTDGQCGANGKTCTGSTFGKCCSASGWCGDDAGFCEAGCQSGFGTCNGGASNISTDGQCGANGKTCKGSSFGTCCSASGWCGSDAGFCSAGCQAAFGTCTSGTGNISTDSVCGKNGKTCKGSSFGDCCSSSNSCGSSSSHCGAGCQTAFGTCSAGSGSISTDGFCGPRNGKTCKGSTFGDCCSSLGYCGNKSNHCSAGCQSRYGTCNPGSGGITTNGQCGPSSNGKTCSGTQNYGLCCSYAGNCGNTVGHCGQGCITGYSENCLTANIPSVLGSCGKQNGGVTCNGGEFNNQCCSQDGWCGATSTHCGSGCQKGFGRCN